MLVIAILGCVELKQIGTEVVNDFGIVIRITALLGARCIEICGNLVDVLFVDSESADSKRKLGWGSIPRIVLNVRSTDNPAVVNRVERGPMASIRLYAKRSGHAIVVFTENIQIRTRGRLILTECIDFYRTQVLPPIRLKVDLDEGSLIRQRHTL